MTAIEKFPRATLDPTRRTGLILCGMGGPDRPEAVRPFLRNLFRDPLIFPVPRLFAGIVGATPSRMWTIVRGIVSILIGVFGGLGALEVRAAEALQHDRTRLGPGLAVRHTDLDRGVAA